MPSPVGHTLFTISLIRLMGKKIFKSKILLLAGLLFGLLPDIDLVLIILFGFKEGGKYHQLYTHSIFFVIIIFLLILFFSRNLKLSLSLSFLVFMHSFLDIFSIDTKEPIGVPILSPLSFFTLNIGILPKIEKSSLYSLFSKNNIYAMLIELAIFLPLLFLVFFSTKSKRDSQSHLKSF